MLTMITYYKLLSNISQKLSKFNNLIIIINQLTTWWINYLLVINYDMLPSSFIDFNALLKWKQHKSKESRHALWLVTLWGVEGRVGTPGWD
jgi:hypothetical protein